MILEQGSSAKKKHVCPRYPRKPKASIRTSPQLESLEALWTWTCQWYTLLYQIWGQKMGPEPKKNKNNGKLTAGTCKKAHMEKEKHWHKNIFFFLDFQAFIFRAEGCVFESIPQISETKEICERFSHQLKFSHAQIQDSAENRPLKSFWKLGRSHIFPKNPEELETYPTNWGCHT